MGGFPGSNFPGTNSGPIPLSNAAVGGGAQDVVSALKGISQQLSSIYSLLSSKLTSVGGGVVTLATAPATTTVVTAAGVTSTSRVHLSPQTQDAAANMATTWITAGNGQFTVSHTSSALTDRTFAWDAFQ